MSKLDTPKTVSRVPAELSEYQGDRQFATTLARGMQLLRCFSPEQPVLGNKDFAHRLGLPAATVSRLTYTLMCMGYLAPAGTYGKYRLGTAVLSLSYPLLELFHTRVKARPLMLELALETRGSVSIGVRDRFNMVYVEAIRSTAKRAYPLDVGTQRSLAGSALGRAWLMACRPPEREAVLNQLRVKVPQEWERYGGAVLQNIERYAHDECCVSVGELYSDVQAVAVPIGRIDGVELAALSCSFQGRAMDEEWLRLSIAPRLRDLVRSLG